MKILFVVENYVPHIGGLETLFKNVAEGCVRAGHEVILVTHRLKETSAFEIINGVRVHRVNSLYSRYFFTLFSVPLVILLAKDADIIHTTTFNGAPPAWIAAKLRKKPVLITVHEVWIGKWGVLADMPRISAGIHDILERMIYCLRFDRYICVSQFSANELMRAGIPESKIGVIYNGIDYSLWNNKNYNKQSIRKEKGLLKNFVCLFYGRPGPSKGLEYLIRAIPEVAKKIKNIRLIAIVSNDRAYKKRLQHIVDLIVKEKMKEQIQVLNPVPFEELPGYVKMSDCVVVPSLSEGFGLSAAESCAMRVPVVASNVAALPEVLSGKFIFVPPRSPHALAESIIAVHHKKYSTTPLKRFYWRETLKKYQAEYLRLLQL